MTKDENFLDWISAVKIINEEIDKIYLRTESF